MSALAHWFKENQALAILLIGQAIVGGIYLRMAWSLARNALRPAHQRRVST